MTNRCSACGEIETLLAENHCSKCYSSQNINIKEISFIRALFYLFDSFAIMIKDYTLIKHSIIPLCLTFIVLILSYISAFSLFILNLNKYLPANDMNNIFITLSKYFLGGLGTIIIAILIIFLFLPISSLICIPFNDILSNKTEIKLLGYERETISTFSEVTFMIKEAVKLLLFKILFMLLFLPINLIPVIGNISYLFILSMLVSIDFLDIIMSRKKYTLFEKIAFIKTNFSYFIAFSIPFLILFWIPLIQILIIPCGAIGATLFFLEGKKSNI